MGNSHLKDLLYLKDLIETFVHIGLSSPCRQVLRKKDIRELARAFLRRGRQPEKNISCARTVLSPRFLYYSSLMEKRYLAM